MARYPTPEQVAIAWVSSIDEVPDGKVATSLPADPTQWPDGFVTVLSVGGASSVYVPLSRPVISIDCWANNPSSSKPPWGKAGSLAGSILAATYATKELRQFTVLPGYHPVQFMSVYPLAEPRRVPGDESGFAHYQFDVTFVYTLVAA